MKINSNSNNIALNTMNTQETEKEKQLKKLSTGLSVSNTDAANQIIFDMLQSNASELLQGVQNGNDAVGYMQVADSALQSVTSGAQQLNVLSVAMNNGSLNAMDKAALTQQAQGIQSSMSDAVNNTTYNGNSVFGNTSFNIGSGTISVDITQPNLSDLNISNQSTITDFLNQTNQTRSNVGSAINQTLAGIKNNLGVITSEKASASQIGDTDIASTVNELNKNMLQSNASAYALAHKQDYLAKQASKLLAY
jgi:flagellin